MSQRAEAVAGAEPIGRRESNKRIKAARIRAAATKLFHKHGYRETTMQMIADAARVAQGTLFLYAADKRDLLLLIVNDELDAITANTFSSVDRTAPFIDQLMHVFAARYRYWGTDPELSLRALQEVLVREPGDARASSQFKRYQRRFDDSNRDIMTLLAEQQARGRIRQGDDLAMLTNVIMAIYLASQRTWLRNLPLVLDDGLARLRAMLLIALRGIEGPSL